MKTVQHSDDLGVPSLPINKGFLPSSDKDMPSEEDLAKLVSSDDNDSVY